MANNRYFVIQVSNTMDPKDLVNLIEILNPTNKPGRITIICRMGAENMRVKLPHLIRAVRQAGQIVTWVCDPMHGNTIKAPCGLKTRPFDAILVLFLYCFFFSFHRPLFVLYVVTSMLQKKKSISIMKNNSIPTVWSSLNDCHWVTDPICVE